MSQDHEHQQAAEIACPLLHLLCLCHELEVRLAQQSGISVGELRCLRLFLFDRQYSVKELAKQSGLSSSRVSRILDRLEEDGMIFRSIDHKDHRVFLVTLTTEGTEFVAQLRRRINELRASMMQEIPPESIETPIRVLEDMLDAFARKLGTIQRSEVRLEDNLA